jgi:hypothetical protein
MIEEKSVELEDLDKFCDLLPEPIIAKPVVRGRGRKRTLSLQYPGNLVNVVENGKPRLFQSIDLIVYWLDGVPNVDSSKLIEKTVFWQYAY